MGCETCGECRFWGPGPPRGPGQAIAGRCGHITARQWTTEFEGWHECHLGVFELTRPHQPDTEGLVEELLSVTEFMFVGQSNIGPYRGTLGHRPLVPGRFTAQVGTERVEDDRKGGLVGSGGSEGTLDYLRGDYSLILAAPLPAEEQVFACYVYQQSMPSGEAKNEKRVAVPQLPLVCDSCEDRSKERSSAPFCDAPEDIPRKRPLLAVVSGTSRGLGNVLREYLLREGWEVYTIERTPIAPSAPLHHPCQGDVRVPSDVEKVFREVRKRNSSPPDVVVNNAAVNHIVWLLDLELSQFQDVVDTMLVGAFNMCKQFWVDVQHYQQNAHIPGGYRIVNIGSLAGHQPMRASLPYNTGKAALDMMTRQMARELAPLVSVCSVNPGKIADTAMTKQLDAAIPEARGWSKVEAHRHQMDYIPVGRYTTCAEVVDLIFYAMTAPDFVNGSLLQFDGGV